jgi:hypothetical protein
VELPGSGNHPVVRGLLELQKSEGVDILFLLETKLDERRMQWLQWSLGLVNIVVKDCEGKGGELQYCGREELMWHFVTIQSTILTWM